MENPIDHTLDLGFVNYVQHPENKNYVVFRFADTVRAVSFEEELQIEKIWFEKGEEDKKGKIYWLYGIRNQDFKKAEKINYRVEARHKKRIIPNRGFRWLVIGFSAIVMTLTLIGYCKAQNKLAQATKTTQQSFTQ